jgi:hypothetical protein
MPMKLKVALLGQWTSMRVERGSTINVLGFASTNAELRDEWLSVDAVCTANLFGGDAEMLTHFEKRSLTHVCQVLE